MVLFAGLRVLADAVFIIWAAFSELSSFGASMARVRSLETIVSRGVSSHCVGASLQFGLKSCYHVERACEALGIFGVLLLCT